MAPEDKKKKMSKLDEFLDNQIYQKPKMTDIKMKKWKRPESAVVQKEKPQT
jgi:hypothetical protein